MVPSNDSGVVLDIGSNDILYISSDIVLANLTISGGGTLYIANNASVTVHAYFSFQSGQISGPDHVSNGSTAPAIVCLGHAYIEGGAAKTLRSVRLDQSGGSLQWTDGELTLSNATVWIHPSAQLLIEPAVSSSSMHLRASSARDLFDRYSNSVLNSELSRGVGVTHLRSAVPVTEALYDVMLPLQKVKVRHFDTDSGLETFTMSVQQEVEAAVYYATQVSDSPGFKYSLYNATFVFTSIDECAMLCADTYSGWCQSFDYHYLNRTCLLSEFTAHQVGGLTSGEGDYVSTNSSNANLTQQVALPVGHYALRSGGSRSTVDSWLTVEGSMQINTEVTIEVNVEVVSGGSIVVSEGAHVTSTATLEVSNHSTLHVAPSNTSITWSGPRACLQLLEGGVLSIISIVSQADYTVAIAASLLTADELTTHLNSSLSSMSSTTKLTFLGGSHVLGGTVFGNGSSSMAVEVAGPDTTLALQASNDTSLPIVANASAVALALGSLYVHDGATVTLTHYEQTHLKLGGMWIADDGELQTNYIEVGVLGAIIVDPTGTISASGMGHAVGLGPGAGTAHTLGASGAAHGGRGGASGTVDAIGQPYGSTVRPAEAGSGGGTGQGTIGGAGGGVILIRAVNGEVAIRGSIRTDGQAGVVGGGGGAGGSVSITAAVISGDGLLSSSGGDGDFSGGRVAAGGGAGGRVALAAATNLTFIGSVNLSGGLRTGMDQEQAGAGTLYALSTADQVEAIVVSNQLLSGYFDNIKDRLPLTAAEVEAEDLDLTVTTETKTYREAYVWEDSSAFAHPGGDSPCGVDLHVIGSSPVLLTGSGASFCLKSVIGSGHAAAVHVDNGIELTFAQSTPTSFELEWGALKLLNCTFDESTNITVSSGGGLYLTDLTPSPSNEAGPANSGSGKHYSFHLLSAISDGGIFLSNSSLHVSAVELKVLNSNVTVDEGAYLAVQDALLANATFTGTASSAVATVDLVSTSSAVYYGDMFLSRVNLVHEGNVYIDGSIVFDADATSAVSFTNASTVYIGNFSTSTPTDVTTDVTFAVALSLDGEVQVSAGSTVTLMKGGICYNCSIELLSSESILTVAAGSFSVIGQHVATGVGTLHVTSTGVLLPAAITTASTFTMLVDEGGVLEVGNHHSDYTDAYYPLRTNADAYFLPFKVVIGSSGTLSLGNGSALVSGDLTIHIGGQILLPPTASITMQGRGNFTGGSLIGSGNFTIAQGGMLTLQPINSSAPLAVTSTVISNHGTIIMQDNVVTFVRSAVVDNYGEILIDGDQLWTFDSSLSSFLDRGYCVYGDGSFSYIPEGGVPVVNGTSTSAACASLCLTGQVPVTRVGAIQTPITTVKSCESFLFNAATSECRLHSTPDPEVHGLCSASASATMSMSMSEWQVYSKIAAWVTRYSYTHTLIHSYTHTLIHFIHSYTHTLIHLYTYTLIHSYTYTLIYSYTHTLTAPSSQTSPVPISRPWCSPEGNWIYQ